MLWLIVYVNGLNDRPAHAEAVKEKESVILTAKEHSPTTGPSLLSGGPDGYGYLYYSTQDGDSVDFNWIDITGTGTAVGAGDDWCSGSSDSTLYYLGFSFPFYESVYDSVSICSNGAIVFDDPYVYFGLSNTSLPSTSYEGPRAIVAIMWDDLDPPEYGGDIYFQSFSSCPDGYSGACAVIEYYHVPRYGNSVQMDFEMILYDNGSIRLLYNSQIYYNDATIGIQAEGADTVNNYYLQYVYGGNPSEHVPDSGTAILFMLPPPADHDIAVNSIIFPQFDFYTFYPAGQGPAWPQTGDVAVVIQNKGLNDESGFDLTLNLNGNIHTETGLSLTSGSTDTIVFSSLSIEEINTAIAYHNLATDERPTNDTATVSMDYSALYKVGDTITYADTLDATDAIGTNGTLGPTRIAVKFDSSDLYLFTGKYIEAIFFYHCWPGATSGCISGGNNAVAIYPDASGVPDHSNPLFRKDIGDIGTTPGLIFVPLDSVAAADTAFLRIGTFPFYVAREVENLASGYPFGAENGCTAGKGCWISTDSLNSGAWAQLTDYGLDLDWILGMVITDTADYVGAGESIIVPGDAKLVRSVVNGYLILNAPANEDMTIEMYNTAGKLVRKVLIRKGADRAFVGKLPTGAYFYITSNRRAGSLIVR